MPKLLVILFLFLSASVHAEELLRFNQNVYGPGVSSDQYGRAFEHDPSLEIRSNVYGPGIGADQYGRPLYQGRDALTLDRPGGHNSSLADQIGAMNRLRSD